MDIMLMKKDVGYLLFQAGVVVAKWAARQHQQPRTGGAI